MNQHQEIIALQNDKRQKQQELGLWRERRWINDFEADQLGGDIEREYLLALKVILNRTMIEQARARRLAELKTTERKTAEEYQQEYTGRFIPYTGAVISPEAIAASQYNTAAWQEINWIESGAAQVPEEKKRSLDAAMDAQERYGRGYVSTVTAVDHATGTITLSSATRKGEKYLRDIEIAVDRVRGSIDPAAYDKPSKEINGLVSRGLIDAAEAKPYLDILAACKLGAAPVIPRADGRVPCTCDGPASAGCRNLAEHY